VRLGNRCGLHEATNDESPLALRNLFSVHRQRVIQATTALSFGRIRKRLSASHQGRFDSANRGEIGFHFVVLDLLDQP